MREVCEHVKALMAYLKESGLEVWSEHGEDGWVNVWCEKCQVTHEVVLRGE